MAVCYLCGRELVKREETLRGNEFTDDLALRHKEHIIPNALVGKLKSDEILCENCGKILGQKIDVGFTQIFEPITEQLRNILAPKDHGSNRSKILRGVLFPQSESLDEEIEIEYKDGKVSPRDPYYEIDEDHRVIKIYANSGRAEHYFRQVEPELRGIVPELDSYKVEYVTDVQNQGVLALLFTGAVENFNDKFALGMNKIATGFAAFHGIDRRDLPRTLNLQKGEIILTKNILPFVPISSFDQVFELNRPALESNYPTHLLILFTIPNGSNSLLVCYVELFGTFQWYVLLNDNYKGQQIYEVYYQGVMRQEYPEANVRRIKPKNLHSFMEWVGIDTTAYKGNSIAELYDFVEEEYRKLRPNYAFDFTDELEAIAGKLVMRFATLETKSELTVQDPISTSFEFIQKYGKQSFLAEAERYVYRDPKFFRRYFFENDGNDGIERLSYPHEIINELAKKTILMGELNQYGYAKFDQLSRFIYQSSPEQPRSEQEELAHLLSRIYFRIRS